MTRCRAARARGACRGRLRAGVRRAAALALVRPGPARSVRQAHRLRRRPRCSSRPCRAASPSRPRPRPRPARASSSTCAMAGAPRSIRSTSGRAPGGQSYLQVVVRRFARQLPRRVAGHEPGAAQRPPLRRRSVELERPGRRRGHGALDAGAIGRARGVAGEHPAGRGSGVLLRLRRERRRVRHAVGHRRRGHARRQRRPHGHPGLPRRAGQPVPLRAHGAARPHGAARASGYSSSRPAACTPPRPDRHETVSTARRWRAARCSTVGTAQPSRPRRPWRRRSRRQERSRP